MYFLHRAQRCSTPVLRCASLVGMALAVQAAGKRALPRLLQLLQLLQRLAGCPAALSPAIA